MPANIQGIEIESGVSITITSSDSGEIRRIQSQKQYYIDILKEHESGTEHNTHHAKHHAAGPVSH